MAKGGAAFDRRIIARKVLLRDFWKKRAEAPFDADDLVQEVLTVLMKEVPNSPQLVDRPRTDFISPWDPPQASWQYDDGARLCKDDKNDLRASPYFAPL